MTYINRVFRVFLILTAISLVFVLIFYFLLYIPLFDTDAILSGILIIGILSFIIPLASDDFKKKSLLKESLHPDWKNIIKNDFAGTHHIDDSNPERIRMRKKEHPLLRWFFLGRRDTYIVSGKDEIIIYGPSTVATQISDKIFQ